MLGKGEGLPSGWTCVQMSPVRVADPTGERVCGLGPTCGRVRFPACLNVQSREN
jgi:hypothetical protein